MHYFNPQKTGILNFESKELTYDELEAMRLKHLPPSKTQEECADLMNVSQSTFSRVLESAHRKLTEALVEGKSIHIIDAKHSVQFFIGYACSECNNEWKIEIDMDSIKNPLELTKNEIEELLPLKGIHCPKEDCNSSKIYRLVRMMG
jgi:predicted DNA-binding protein (UPF0251 family)